MDSNIHVRIDRDESVIFKKNLLLSEKGLLEIIKHMRKYQALRNMEYALKNKIKIDLANVKKEIVSIESDMPKLGLALIHEQISSKNEKMTQIKEEKSKKVKQKSDIERQLDEIHEKLSRL